MEEIDHGIEITSKIVNILKYLVTKLNKNSTLHKENVSSYFIHLLRFSKY